MNDKKELGIHQPESLIENIDNLWVNKALARETE